MGEEAGTEYNVSYDYNAKLYDPTTGKGSDVVNEDYQGVYTTELQKNEASEDAAPTIGMPSIADGNLVDSPTTEAPAIIQGAATGYEEKTGATEYETLKNRVAPYDEFKWSVVEEQAQDGTTHKKLTGFDGTYVIIRLEVSDLLKDVPDEQKATSYLHLKQDDNNALLVAVGMNAAETSFIGQPTLADGTVGNVQMTAVYSYADLLDAANGGRFVDIILFATASIVSGADAGKSGALNGDVPLHFYVDQTKDYDPDTKWDAASTDPALVQKCLDKFYKAEEATKAGVSNYLVKGSDLALEVAVESSGGAGKDTATTYWSLNKAIQNSYYDLAVDADATDSGCGRTVKLISEVPITSSINFEGVDANNLRKRTLDVNSFDIQIANNTSTTSSGFTLKNAWLKLEDKSNTTGAEMAIGNNARFVINEGGKLIIDETCQLEIEWDGATTTTPGEDPGTLNNGILDLNAGGELVNNGIITIEGTEGKPAAVIDPTTQKGFGELTVEQGATLTNNGAILVYGKLYNLGNLVNNGKYDDLITSNDPDKGLYSYHRGIQVSWKDDVTQAGVTKGELINGADSTGAQTTSATLTNNGDIVLTPGKLVNYGTLTNGNDAGIYLATATEAIIPIEPDPAAPTIVTKRVTLANPEPSSVINYGTLINYGWIVPASVELLDNGGFGKLSVPGSNPENFDLQNYGTLVNYGYIWSPASAAHSSLTPATGDTLPTSAFALEGLGLAAAAVFAASRRRKSDSNE